LELPDGCNCNPDPRDGAACGHHPAIDQRVRSASKKHSEDYIPSIFAVVLVPVL